MKFDRYMGRHYDVQVLDHFTVSAQLSRQRAADHVESLALDIFSNPFPVALQLIEQRVPVPDRQDFYEAAMLIESGHPDEAIQDLRSRASFLALLAFDARVWRASHQHERFSSRTERRHGVTPTLLELPWWSRDTKQPRVSDELKLPTPHHFLPCLLSPNAPNAAAASIMRNAA